ncbi:MAG: DUF3016 domain-containing protein [Verrucomicrobia bacterium]|nr:DUF3016 domain-containing protein [Verrucomicrobiota bacterium]MDA1066966.1 DUF3016 domain-containing protein [Verrucomicrobiota bacterium]
MKRILLLGILIFISQTLSAEVILNFGDPEEFKDFEYAQTRRTISTEFFSKEIIRELQRSLEKSFSEGAVLTLDFQDIDLAGHFEPWQPTPLDDVRIFKDRYPPSAQFSYRLVDKNGVVLAEGNKELRYLGFQDGGSRRTGATDTFYYERRMLERWIRSELKKEVEGDY